MGLHRTFASQKDVADARVEFFKRRRRSDIRVENHGTICLLHGFRRPARRWLKRHVSSDAQWWGLALVVEPRYVADIVNGARAAGLEVR